MPFDGTSIEPQVVRDLRATRTLLEKGWCRDQLYNFRGEHCVMGALQNVTRSLVGGTDCVLALETTLGGFEYYNLRKGRGRLAYKEYGLVAFNNAQETVGPVLDLIDRTIDRLMQEALVAA